MQKHQTLKRLSSTAATVRETCIKFLAQKFKYFESFRSLRPGLYYPLPKESLGYKLPLNMLSLLELALPVLTDNEEMKNIPSVTK